MLLQTPDTATSVTKWTHSLFVAERVQNWQTPGYRLCGLQSCLGGAESMGVTGCIAGLEASWAGPSVVPEVE